MQMNLYGTELIKDILLRDKFIEPPFSVLDTKTGSWQNRKRIWISKGLKSELGRDVKAYTCNNDTHKRYNYMPSSIKDGTSIFDPALCELMYYWFCPENGTILDPFAGGSVRGIVAHYLGFHYTGIELRMEQVIANQQNAKDVLKNTTVYPQWYTGDSDNILPKIKEKFDLIFTCPPYMNLEIYSDDINDLSNMDDAAFIYKYESIIRKACLLLKKDGFAIFVVGDIRDSKTGFYKDFITITKQAFYKANMGLYNEAILLNIIGTACIRSVRPFEKNKKLTKIHQNVLIFKKGIV